MVECVVINSVDFRVRLPIIAYTDKHFGMSHSCFLTAAQPSYLIVENRDSKAAKELLQELLVLSLEYKLKTIVIVSHAGHANDTVQTQLTYLDDAVQTLAKLHRGTEVVGLWVNSEGFVLEVAREAML